MSFRVIHKDGVVQQIIEVSAGARTYTASSQFDKPTRDAALAEIASRGLLLLDTPARKQRHLFDLAAQADPAMVAPFLKLVEPLTELNAASEASGDYTASKTFLNAVVIDTDAQAAVKAQLLACYP